MLLRCPWRLFSTQEFNERLPMKSRVARARSSVAWAKLEGAGAQTAWRRSRDGLILGTSRRRAKQIYFSAGDPS